MFDRKSNSRIIWWNSLLWLPISKFCAFTVREPKLWAQTPQTIEYISIRLFDCWIDYFPIWAFDTWLMSHSYNLLMKSLLSVFFTWYTFNLVLKLVSTPVSCTTLFRMKSMWFGDEINDFTVFLPIYWYLCCNHYFHLCLKCGSYGILQKLLCIPLFSQLQLFESLLHEI